MSTDNPNIDFVHPDLLAVLPRYQMISDCLEGEEAVKHAGRGGDAYLIRPNQPNQMNSRPARLDDDGNSNSFWTYEQITAEQDERFRQLVARAVFYNVTGRTHRGLVGAVFKKEPVVTLPEMLPTLEEDCDGAGVPLAQQAEKAAGYALSHGRYGLLVDYPSLDRAATRAEILDGKIRPTIVLYKPNAVINWRTISVGASRVLSLVVVRETVTVSDDGFESETQPRWRVLQLVPGVGEDGLVYQVTIWRQSSEGKVYEHDEPIVPRDASDKPFPRIPFLFGGAINNDPDVDQPPLADIASMNIAHYRNSADHEEMLHMCGQATPVAAGLTEDWAREILQGEVRLGSRGLLPLPAGGSANLLQMSPNSAIAEEMKHKEAQMLALGAKLVELKQVQRTATEAAIDDAAEMSVLGTCVRNTEAAYRWALRICCDFVGANRDAVDFVIPWKEDPQPEPTRVQPAANNNSNSPGAPPPVDGSVSPDQNGTVSP